ncbi:unnamed protein product, partial [Discosporangium mesarthrocarpum]
GLGYREGFDCNTESASASELASYFPPVCGRLQSELGLGSGSNSRSGLRRLLQKTLSLSHSNHSNQRGGGSSSTGTSTRSSVNAGNFGTVGGGFDVLEGDHHDSGLMASQLLDLALRWLMAGEESFINIAQGSAAFPNPNLSGRSSVGGVRGTGPELGLGLGLSVEVILFVFEAMPAARPRVLRELVGGVVDESRGRVSGHSYLAVWERLMAREAQHQCLRVVPHAQIVSDAIHNSTLLPTHIALRLVESTITLANASEAHADALLSLCRKCASQGGSKGPLLAVHAVTSMITWTMTMTMNTMNTM